MLREWHSTSFPSPTTSNKSPKPRAGTAPTPRTCPLSGDRYAVYEVIDGFRSVNGCWVEVKITGLPGEYLFWARHCGVLMAPRGGA